MKSCKLVLMIPILLLVALATACDNDSIARNTSDECPGTYLMPITSSSEFKREYFRRNSSLGEPACVSPLRHHELVVAAGNSLFQGNVPNSG